MTIDRTGMTSLLEELVALIEIPESHYQLAVDRYESLGRWFHRNGSLLLPYDPQVYPQGSFRYGTVIRPLLKHEYYDLDLVCQVAVSKSEFTQKRLKELVGEEVKSYADAKKFNEPAIPKRRCWRLNYADDVSFHMDILPAAPDDAHFISLLIAAGVEPELARLAVAITDIEHTNFSTLDSDWPRSNPRGFGRRFEARMRVASLSRRKRLVEARLYASVDDVPVYAWKTPLQRSIQILKRHRDVMFRNNPQLKPISMILTTLAAEAYAGELELFDALSNILDRMPNHVSRTRPRVPNPVNPAEDFADRWESDPQLEENFWAWHQKVKSDLSTLALLTGTSRDDLLRGSFDVEYRSNQPSIPTRTASSTLPAVHIAPAAVRIVTPPRPWGA